MAIDTRGLVNQYPEWAGLYKMADNLEERNLKQQALSAQQAGKRGAAGTFLQNYLDPKDYLSGTAFDPMILQGLQEAMQKGSQLAIAGADSPTLMMALGPMVNRLTKYSSNAKNINKQIDETIANMKADKQEGYDWAALQKTAREMAFYKPGLLGQMELDPDKADPSVNWVAKALEESPEKVTTAEAFDLYAKNAQMTKNLVDVTDADRFNNTFRSKVQTVAQNYLRPEIDKKTGKISGFVPHYQNALEGDQDMLHTFMDESGNPVKTPIRLLDKGIFESLRPGQINYLRGKVKASLQEHEKRTGEKISMDSPKAKLLARAFAYDELNMPTRKATNIEFVQKENQSPQQTTLNVHMTPEYLASERAIAAQRKQGRMDVTGGDLNAVQSIGAIFNGEADYISGDLINKHNKKVIDVTSRMPGGGLKTGRGEDFDYKGIYFDPFNRTLILEKETKDKIGQKIITPETITESQIGPFLAKIAEANGVNYTQVRKLLDEMGYSAGKFRKAKDLSPMLEFEKRKAEKSWKDVYNKPTSIAPK